MAEKTDKQKLGESSVPQGAWRKFHKVTPLADAGTTWLALGAFIAVIIAQIVENQVNDLGFYIELITPTRVLIGVGILLGLTAIFVGVGAVMWRHKSYAIVPSGVHYRNGIVMKKYQHVRWDRVQSVEVEQRLFARIFGFGAVKVDAAGFAEDPVELGLLPLDQCRVLREEILASLAKARGGVLTEVSIADDDATAPHQPLDPQSSAPATQPAVSDQMVYHLPTKRLIPSTILTGSALFSIAGVILAAVWKFVFESGFSVAFLFFIAGTVVNSIKYISGSFNTKVFLAENGLKIRHGLTKLVTRSLPPTRIHAVSIKQPLLWRRFDWWQVTVTIAGSSLEDMTDNASNVIVPCGSRAEVIRVVSTIFPTLGTDDDARLMDELMYRKGKAHFLETPPKRVRWIDPIAGTVGAFYANVRVFAIRRGRLWRSVQLIFQDHTQSVAIQQGPLQRWLRLASVHVHMLVGPVHGIVKNFDIDQMHELVLRQNALTKQAREIEVSETIDEWKARLNLVGDVRGE